MIYTLKDYSMFMQKSKRKSCEDYTWYLAVVYMHYSVYNN